MDARLVPVVEDEAPCTVAGDPNAEARQFRIPCNLVAFRGIRQTLDASLGELYGIHWAGNGTDSMSTQCQQTDGYGLALIVRRLALDVNE